MNSKNLFYALCAITISLAIYAMVTNIGLTGTLTSMQVFQAKVEVKQLNDDSAFDAEMNNAKTLVLVDFTATWCGPCQALKPKIEQLAQEFRGKVVFTKVEQTVAPGLSTRNNVTAFPTVKIFAPGGKELSSSVGNLPINDMRKWIQEQVDAFDKTRKAQTEPQTR